MSRRTLAIWLAVLGAALWFASRVVDTQPTFAMVVGLAVLIFGAFAARPYQN